MVFFLEMRHVFENVRFKSKREIPKIKLQFLGIVYLWLLKLSPDFSRNQLSLVYRRSVKIYFELAFLNFPVIFQYMARMIGFKFSGSFSLQSFDSSVS